MILFDPRYDILDCHEREQSFPETSDAILKELLWVENGTDEDWDEFHSTEEK